MFSRLIAPENRNITLLAACSALYTCASAIGLTLTALVGAMLASTRSLATLPYALVIVATASSTVPASICMARFGRKPIFMLGAAAGAIGGGLSASAIVQGSFERFCVASVFLGMFQACAQYYRFAATESASPATKPRAVAMVISGGVVAAVVGPTLATWAQNVLPPHTFAGSYAIVVVLAVASVLVLAFLESAPTTAVGTTAQAMPLATIVRRPAFVVGVASSALGYAVMVFIMTATPLAMLGCGLEVGDAASVIQWHLLSMFAPGFFTGRLIQRFGSNRMLLFGVGALVAASLIACSGESFAHFAIALALNGLGWNFLYVGGTTLLTSGFDNASAADRARAQAASEFITFAAVAIATLLAGVVFEGQGWTAVNWAVLPFAVVTAGFILWRPKRAVASGTGAAG